MIQLRQLVCAITSILIDCVKDKPCINRYRFILFGMIFLLFVFLWWKISVRRAIKVMRMDRVLSQLRVD